MSVLLTEQALTEACQGSVNKAKQGLHSELRLIDRPWEFLSSYNVCLSPVSGTGLQGDDVSSTEE